jgi:hypothetical protein
MVSIFDNQTVRGRALRPRPFSLFCHPLETTAGQDFVAKEFIAIQYKKKSLLLLAAGDEFLRRSY